VNIEGIKKLAYWTWRRLPVQFELSDITSVAMVGALQAGDGLEKIAAKRAIIDHLRKENQGSRSNGKISLTTLWWNRQEHQSCEPYYISEETRLRLIRAVDTLSTQEMAVINGLFWEEKTSREIARELGKDESRVSQIKHAALAKLRYEMEAA